MYEYEKEGEASAIRPWTASSRLSACLASDKWQTRPWLHRGALQHRTAYPSRFMRLIVCKYAGRAACFEMVGVGGGNPRTWAVLSHQCQGGPPPKGCSVHVHCLRIACLASPHNLCFLVLMLTTDLSGVSTEPRNPDTSARVFGYTGRCKAFKWVVYILLPSKSKAMVLQTHRLSWYYIYIHTYSKHHGQGAV